MNKTPPPPPPPPTPGSLANSAVRKWGLGLLLQKIPVHGLYYRNQEVHLAGYEFKNCRFDHCTLFVGSGNFALTNCIVDPTTTIHYADDLVPVIQLFTSRPGIPHHGFYATQNPDGTISIGRPNQ